MIEAAPPGRAGGRLADLRPRVPAPVPVRHVQAVPGAGLAVPAVRLPEAGKDAGGAGSLGAASTGRSSPAPSSGFNAHAREGEDPEFGRGRTAFNRGVRRPGARPNPSLAPIEKGAVLRDQGAARQLRHLLRAAEPTPTPGCSTPRAAPIDGLYAAGSDQANVMGGHYPSGGINIGPAMTFGYIAGRHAAGVRGLRERRPGPAERRRLTAGVRTAIGIDCERMPVSAVVRRLQPEADPQQRRLEPTRRGQRGERAADTRRARRLGGEVALHPVAIGGHASAVLTRRSPQRCRTAACGPWMISSVSGSVTRGEPVIACGAASSRSGFRGSSRRPGYPARHPLGVPLAAVRGHPDRRVDLPVAGVAADPLHHLEEDPAAETSV